MRWLSLAVGIALIAVAFAAATRVADTRDGLIAEVILLFSALVGITLILYGMFATIRPRGTGSGQPAARPPAPSVRSVRDLLVGGAGVAVAVILLGGLAASAGIQWAGLGAVLLLPMIAGSLYLCVRFLRAPMREWKVVLRKPEVPKQP